MILQVMIVDNKMIRMELPMFTSSMNQFGLLYLLYFQNNLVIRLVSAKALANGTSLIGQLLSLKTRLEVIFSNICRSKKQQMWIIRTCSCFFLIDGYILKCQPCRESICNLLYVMVFSHPRIAYGIGRLSIYADNFRDLHRIAFKITLLYVGGTKCMRIPFGGKFTIFILLGT